MAYTGARRSGDKVGSPGSARLKGVFCRSCGTTTNMYCVLCVAGQGHDIHREDVELAWYLLQQGVAASCVVLKLGRGTVLYCVVKRWCVVTCRWRCVVRVEIHTDTTLCSRSAKSMSCDDLDRVEE